LSGGRLWRDCRALSGMVPAMLRGRGLRGGALGRSTTDADIWLEAIECSEATDMDDLGREGDCCCCCSLLPAASEARVGRGSTANWLMLRACLSRPCPAPAEGAAAALAPLPSSTMLFDMSTPPPCARLEGGPASSSMLLFILGEAWGAGGSSLLRGCARRSRRDMLTAR
ncbi:unnamed protein product, partial [Ixodes pacificus]